MWLKDTNGALYRIEAIAAVTPLDVKGDKRDQTKITATYAAISIAGGGTYHTSLDFDEVVKLVNPPPRVAAAPSSTDQTGNG